MTKELIFPLIAHLFWMVILYSALTVARAPAVWNIGQNKEGGNPFATIEPRISANVSNQFEWPLLFYAVSVLALANPKYFTPVLVYLAWVFVAGRFVHSYVQIFTTNIRLRGIVFTINFVAVIAMWCVAASQTT